MCASVQAFVYALVNVGMHCLGYIYVYKCACVHTNVFECACLCKCMCDCEMCICVWVVCMHVCAYMHVLFASMCEYVQVCVHACECVHVKMSRLYVFF